MRTTGTTSTVARTLLVTAMAAAACTLSACGGKDDRKASDLDAELLDDARDPAMTGALEDQILVDPDLTSQNEQNAVLSAGGPATGAVPPATGSGEDGSKIAAALVEKSGGMLHAPEPKQVTAEECGDCAANNRGVTLGAKAAAKSKGACTGELSYSMSWANRMPKSFSVYPKARLKEAAGIDGGSCNMRVVNFVTQTKLKDVVDFYYTSARRSGYDAEYLLREGQYVLGGTRASDDSAYVVFLKPLKSGGTEVDIVANNGT